MATIWQALASAMPEMDFSSGMVALARARRSKWERRRFERERMFSEGVPVRRTRAMSSELESALGPCWMRRSRGRSWDGISRIVKLFIFPLRYTIGAKIFKQGAGALEKCYLFYWAMLPTSRIEESCEVFMASFSLFTSSSMKCFHSSLVYSSSENCKLSFSRLIFSPSSSSSYENLE